MQNLCITTLSKSIAIAFVVIFPFSVAAQNVDEVLVRYFDDIKAEKYRSIPPSLSNSKNSVHTLNALVPYLDDSIDVVRSTAYDISLRAGVSASKSSVSAIAVNQLIQGCRDFDSDNAGRALRYLTSFKKQDFTPSALDSIRSLFRDTPIYFDQLIKLIGFLDLKDLKEEIRYYTQAGHSRQLQWAATIALARMGDAVALHEIISYAKKLPVSDVIVYEVFPDLVYTRQREAIDYVIEVMHHNAKNCTSVEAEREVPIVCGYRIIEQLAPAIEDYPLTVNEQGDVVTDDYENALTMVKQWCKANKDYTILRDNY
jgi:hypothetical protein